MPSYTYRKKAVLATVTGLSLLLLSSCGFHLRGQGHLRQLGQIYIVDSTSGQARFVDALTRRLHQQQALLGTHADQSKHVLRVVQVQSNTERMTNNNASNQSQVYSVSLHVTLALASKAQAKPRAPRSFYAIENLNIGPNESIKTNRQVPEIMATLREQVINQIIYYLISTATQK